MENWPEFLPVHRIALQLGALFHDIGHGPWSHVSELFCQMKDDYRRLRHRELTKEWIRKGVAPYNDVPAFLAKEAKRVEEEWKGMVERDKWTDIEYHTEILSPDNVANIAVGSPPTLGKDRSDFRYTFLSNIVSGVFDVDRMDYLRRDAYHAGFETGGVDIWEIIHSYTLAEEDGKWIAMLLPSASTALEILLSVRDLAYRQFYYNKMHRSAQEMMIRAMARMVEKYSVDELLVMNDEELLAALEGPRGDAFTRDVTARIRLRAVYEPLPFAIRISTDLDDSGKSAWAELAFQVPARDLAIERWLGSEEDASGKMKLPTHQRVVFDLRPIPLVERREYETPIFYDEVKKEKKSLFDLCPHLRMIRGTRLIQFDSKEIKIDLTLQYIEEVSQLLITLPFEYVDGIRESCTKEMAKGKSKDAVLACHVERLKSILEDLISFLRVQDEKTKTGLRQRFKESLTGYLEDICSPASPSSS